MKKKIGALLLAGSMILFLLTGCGPTKETAAGNDDMSKEVHLKWIIANDKVPADYDKVMEEVNKYLKEKINATLEIDFLQSADFATKANMMLASQETGWDLMFTSNWQNPYETNALLGGYYDIKELLQTATPELYDYFPQQYWDALTMLDGGIYAVPMNQVMFQQRGLWFKKDLVEKYDLLEQIEAAKSHADLTPVYETIAENEPTVQPLVSMSVGQFEEPVTSVVAGFVIKDGKVTDELDDSLLERYKITREWYVKGIIPQEVNFDEVTYLTMGRIFSRYNRQVPGAAAKQRMSYDWDIVDKPTTGMVLRREDIQGALTAINRNSKHPERALKLLELMTTDQYLFNLMAYGIEGVNWNFDENGRLVQTENSYYVPEFRIGNQFLGYLMPGHDENIWEETDRLNREAKPDENMGFIFDRSPIETEILNVQSVTEFIDALGNGTAEDVEGTFKKHVEKRKTAGADIVKGEIEKQYAEWKATLE